MQYKGSQGNWVSRVTRATYFLAPDGDRNPLSELQTNLFEFRKIRPVHELHPQCRFPARYEILVKYFQLAPAVSCPVIENWFKEYQPTGISIAYASQHVSNPASAFGHSFFLLRSETVNDYFWITYNYAAHIPDQTNPFKYAYYGIFGGFTGSFDVIPYYHRLFTYNNMDNRDLWIYDLNFSEGERTLLIKYLWELANETDLNYYFLTDNCASILLDAVAVAKSDFKIPNRFILYVPPAELPKVFYDNEMVTSYRQVPALNRLLEEKLRNLSPQDRELFFESIRLYEPRGGLEVLEALMDYLSAEYIKQKGELDPRTDAYRNQVHLARAKLGIRKKLSKNDPPSDPPHLSHDLLKATMGWRQRNDRPFGEIRFRPAIHGFMDPQEGYLPNSGIEVFDLRLAYDDKGPWLHSLKFISIQNFRTITMTENHKSWEVEWKLDHNPYQYDRNLMIQNASGALGFSRELIGLGITGFVLLGADARLGEVAPQKNISYGPITGLIFNSQKSRAHFRAGLALPDEWFSKLELSIFPIRQWSFETHFNHREVMKGSSVANEWGLGLSHYF